jgi:hypothetical protein
MCSLILMLFLSGTLPVINSRFLSTVIYSPVYLLQLPLLLVHTSDLQTSPLCLKYYIYTLDFTYFIILSIYYFACYFLIVLSLGDSMRAEFLM